MTYSTTPMAKSILFIKTADTQFDTWLDELRDYAYAAINTELRPHVTPPLSAGADDYDIIVLAEGEIVAGMFRKHRSEKQKDDADQYWGKGLELSGMARIRKYIKEHYEKAARSDYIAHGRADHSWEQ